MSIAYISGKVLHKSGSWVIVERDSLGYRVEMNTDGLQMGDVVSLFIYHHVREDSQKLFGFKTVADLEVFELLISVSGVGPKVGLAILHSMSAEEILNAIRAEESEVLVKVKGLGKKGAERIVLELKSKIDDFIASTGIQVEASGAGALHDTDDFTDNHWNDARDALNGLGYSANEVDEVFTKIAASGFLEKSGSNNSADAILKESLKYLAR